MSPDGLKLISEQACALWTRTGDHLAAIDFGIGELAIQHAELVFLQNFDSVARANRTDSRRLRQRLATERGDEFGEWIVEQFSTHMGQDLWPHEIEAAARRRTLQFRQRLAMLFASGGTGARG